MSSWLRSKQIPYLLPYLASIAFNMELCFWAMKGQWQAVSNGKHLMMSFYHTFSRWRVCFSAYCIAVVGLDM
jgi:hypothetical protein